MQKTVAVIGGGAAGYFGAIACAETDRTAKVTLLEKSRHVLSKVKISGGGRCNVTHACFEPRALAESYPRGSKELIGPFHRWQPADTVAWFESRGVELKTEPDGRMFPTTDSSSTIVDCLVGAAAELGVETRTRAGVRSVSRTGSQRFVLALEDDCQLEADRVIVATGGGARSGGLKIAQGFGHTVTELAPSLFTFHIDDPRLQGLQGLSVAGARVGCREADLEQTGPVLITHWGLSGPAILKLSAWGARPFARMGYSFELRIHWLGDLSTESVRARLNARKRSCGKKRVASDSPFPLPKRIWARLTEAAGIASHCQWARLSKGQIEALTAQLVDGRFQVHGKSMHKEEFVTCGGVALTEVNFRRMESKRISGLHFAGEVLDIDAITGGFNFQAAWTTGWIAGRSAAMALHDPIRSDTTKGGRKE